MPSGAVIDDIDASNFDGFLDALGKDEGIHESYDRFVVPVTENEMAVDDAVSTIRKLQALGVPQEKIRVVFNKIEPGDRIGDGGRFDFWFSRLSALATNEQSFRLNRESVIHTNEIFDVLGPLGLSLSDICCDETDYRQRLRQAVIDDDENEKNLCVQMMCLKRLAPTAQRNLADVYFDLTDFNLQ